MQHIVSNRQAILVTLATKPGRAGIDPNHLLIDREMKDNFEGVAVKDGGENSSWG